MSHAGRSIRKLALQRRIKAVGLFWTAGTFAISPFLILRFLSEINIKLPAPPVLLYLACGLTAILTAMQGIYFWRRAQNADQGAAGEETIAALLTPLAREGWQIECNIRVPSVGDVDIFLRSPKGNAYVIDVKSHQGTVRSDGEALSRHYGSSQYPFEKDFLQQVKKQAVRMKQLRQVRWITPIVAFSRAQVQVGKEPIAGVHVVGAADLLPCLRSLS